MEVVRRRHTAPVLIAAASTLAACGGGIGGDGDSIPAIDGDVVSLWVVEEAISAQGNAYELSLMEQPMPTVAPGADVGFVGFGIASAPLTITNKVIDQPTPGFEVDTYLFFDCDLLSAEPVSHTERGDLIMTADGWEAEPDRIIAADGGYCVQRLDSISVEAGLAPGADVTVEVGRDDLGFVVPETQQGRIETMLGRPLYVQFGITEASGASFFTERSHLGVATSTTGPADDQRPESGIETAPEGDPTEAAADLMDPATVLELIGEEAFAELMGDDALAELLGTSEPNQFVAGAFEADGFGESDLDDSVTPERADPSTPCPTRDTEPRRIFDGAPAVCIDPAAQYVATVNTTVGEFTIELDAARAPATVNSFVVLARYGFFDDTPCHRIVSDFVAQCGDPTGTGLGGPGYTFADELPDAGQYEIGSVAMANSGPDSNGSQWFVVTGDAGVALPPSYSLFGTVTDGLDNAIVWMNALGSASGTPKSEVRIESVTISTR